MDPQSDGPDRRRGILAVADQEAGATAVEYALLIAFIAAFIVGTVALLGDTAVDLYESVEW